MDKIFLRNDLIVGNTLTQDGVLAYIALRTIIDESIPLYNKTSSADCISVNRLAYSLIGEMDYEKALTDALARGIAELSSGEWISIRKDLSTSKNYEYVLDIEKLWLDKEKDKFTVVYLDDIYKIMTCKDNIDKMDKKLRILKYFVALVSTFDWSLDGKIGYMSEEYIAGLANIAVRTLQRYNVILAEKQILYIYKSNDKVRSDDKLKQIKNCYSRYEDKGICEQYASGYEDMYGVEHKIVRTKKNKEQADNNRRYAQIYNRICEGYGDSYDEATIKKVYNYVTNKNKALQSDINDKYEQLYYKEKGQLSYSDQEWVEKLESQIRDTSIFEQFDFLKSVPKVSEGTGDWGEPDSMEHDFSVEEILDMPTVSEVQPDPTPKVTDCDLQSEGVSESFGINTADNSVIVNSSIANDPTKCEGRKFDRAKLHRENQGMIILPQVDNLKMDSDVLSEEEAWELFA